MADSSVSGLDARAAAVAKQIVRHVRRCPRAADTSVGIAQWWLPPGQQTDLAVVERALRALVSDGVLSARRLPSGEWLYSAAGAGGVDDADDAGGGDGNEGKRKR